MRRLAVLFLVGFCGVANADELCMKLSRDYGLFSKQYIEIGNPVDLENARQLLSDMVAHCGLEDGKARKLAGEMARKQYLYSHGVRDDRPAVQIEVEPDLGSGVTNCFSLTEGTITCVN